MSQNNIKDYNEYLDNLKHPTKGRTVAPFFVDFDKAVKIGKTKDLISIEIVGLNSMDSNLTEDELKQMVSDHIKNYVDEHQPIKKPIDREDFMAYCFIKTGWIVDIKEINIYSVMVKYLDKDYDKKDGDGKGPKNPPLCNYNLIVFPKESAEEKENLPAVEPPSIEI